MRDVLLVVVLWCGTVTAVAAALAVLWRLINPHADKYVGKAVARAIAPVVRDVETIRTELVSRPMDPSIPEQLSEIHEKIAAVSGEVENAALELSAMALMFDGHLEWSAADHDAIRNERQEIVDRIWEELKRQRAAGGTPHRGRHRVTLEDDERT